MTVYLFNNVVHLLQSTNVMIILSYLHFTDNNVSNINFSLYTTLGLNSLHTQLQKCFVTNMYDNKFKTYENRSTPRFYKIHQKNASLRLSVLTMLFSGCNL